MTRRTRNTILILVAVAVTALLLDLRSGPVTGAIRDVGAAVLAPVVRVSGALASPLVMWVQGVEDFGDPATRARLWSAQAVPSVEPRAAARLTQAEALLGLTKRAGISVVAARVVAYPGTGASLENVVVDAGLDDSIAADQAVVNGGGVVGRTTSATARTADVMLISAPGSSVGVRLTRTGQVAVVTGTGDPNRILLKALDPAADVRLGDPVVTFGSKAERPFPPDLLVGTVTAIEGDIGAGRTIAVTPTARLTSLDVVGIVMPSGEASARSATGPTNGVGSTTS